MPNATASVRITPKANELLDHLAGKLLQAKAQVIEDALQLLEERVFWTEVQESFASGEPEEIRAERELWDSTASDGSTGEPW
jgi:predicted transcriptional regulator